MWKPISTAPEKRDLRLAVIEDSGTHVLVFPCRRTSYGWAAGATGKQVHVDPTHWQFWNDDDKSS